MTNSQNDPAGFIPDDSSTQTQSAGSSGTVSPGAKIKDITDWLGSAAQNVGNVAAPPVTKLLTGLPQTYSELGTARDQKGSPLTQDEIYQIQSKNNSTPMDSVAAVGDVLSYTLPFIIGPAEEGANLLGKAGNAALKYGIPGAVRGFAQGNDTSGGDRIGNAALNATTSTGIGGLSEAAMNWLGGVLGKLGINPQTTGTQSVSKADQATQTALDLTKNDLGGGPVTPGGLSKAIMGTKEVPETPTIPGIPGQSGVMDKINGQIGDLLSQTSEKLGTSSYSIDTIDDQINSDLAKNVQGFSSYKGPNGDLDPKVATQALTKDLFTKVHDAILDPPEGIQPGSLQAIDNARSVVGVWAKSQGSFAAGSTSASAQKALIQDIGDETYKSISGFVNDEVKSAGLTGYQGLLKQESDLYAANAGLTGNGNGGIRPFSLKSFATRSLMPTGLLTGARTMQSPISQAFATLGLNNLLTGAQ